MLFNNDTKSMSLVTLWSSYILHTLLNCELYTSCHCTVCKSLIILNSEFVQLYSILYLIQISVGSGLIFIFNWEWWTLKQGLELGVGGVVEVCMCGSRSECPISISQINYFPMLCVCVAAGHRWYLWLWPLSEETRETAWSLIVPPLHRDVTRASNQGPHEGL